MTVTVDLYARGRRAIYRRQVPLPGGALPSIPSNQKRRTVCLDR